MRTTLRRSKPLRPLNAEKRLIRVEPQSGVILPQIAKHFTSKESTATKHHSLKSVLCFTKILLRSLHQCFQKNYGRPPIPQRPWSPRSSVNSFGMAPQGAFVSATWPFVMSDTLTSEDFNVFCVIFLGTLGWNMWKYLASSILRCHCISQFLKLGLQWRVPASPSHNSTRSQTSGDVIAFFSLIEGLRWFGISQKQKEDIDCLYYTPYTAYGMLYAIWCFINYDHSYRFVHWQMTNDATSANPRWQSKYTISSRKRSWNSFGNRLRFAILQHKQFLLVVGCVIVLYSGKIAYITYTYVNICITLYAIWTVLSFSDCFDHPTEPTLVRESTSWLGC